MAKHKKKHGKKNDLTDDLLDTAVRSLKKFRKVTKQVGKLTTAQKVAGGVALLAAGITYLAKTQANNHAPHDDPDANAAEDTLASLGEGHNGVGTAEFAVSRPKRSKRHK